MDFPKAAVQRIIAESLPDNIKCPSETTELVRDCCTEFIRLITAEVNAVCDDTNIGTVTPEHLTAAIEKLGFGQYIEEITARYEELKDADNAASKPKKKRKKKLTKEEEQELQAEQAALLDAARKQVYG